jgi:hypothetical protein
LPDSILRRSSMLLIRVRRSCDEDMMIPSESRSSDTSMCPSTSKN